MRLLKYVLISVFTVFVFSVFAFASDDVNVTVNGVGYSSISDALAVAQSGDRVEVVSNTSFTGEIDIPAGVNFYLNPGVTVSTSTGTILNHGNLNLYGNLNRSGSSDGSTYLVRSAGGSVTNVFGSSVTTSNLAGGISASGGTVNFYGGSVSSKAYTLYATGSGSATIYNGQFISQDFPNTPFTSSNITVVGSFDRSSGVVSFGGLYEVGQIVLEAITWISLIVAAIVANKLLLIFVIVIFVGVGVGLIKRICDF